MAGRRLLEDRDDLAGGERSGSRPRLCAAAAATTGAANDVPSSPERGDETQGPVFENGAWAPSRVTAATASPSAPSSAAGYSGRLA